MANYKSKFNDHSRKLIYEELNKCTDLQKDKFKRIYGSVDNVSGDKMCHAYCIIMKTLEKNNG